MSIVARSVIMSDPSGSGDHLDDGQIPGALPYPDAAAAEEVRAVQRSTIESGVNQGIAVGKGRRTSAQVEEAAVTDVRMFISYPDKRRASLRSSTSVSIGVGAEGTDVPKPSPPPSPVLGASSSASGGDMTVAADPAHPAAKRFDAENATAMARAKNSAGLRHAFLSMVKGPTDALRTGTPHSG